MKFLIITGSYRSGTSFLYKSLNASGKVGLLYQPAIEYFKHIDEKIRNALQKKGKLELPLGITNIKKNINIKKIYCNKKYLISISTQSKTFLGLKPRLKKSEVKLYKQFYHNIFYELKKKEEISVFTLICIILESLKKIYVGKKYKYIGIKEPFLGGIIKILLSFDDVFVVNIIRDPREILCSRNYPEVKISDLNKKKHPVIMTSLICNNNMLTDYEIKNKKNKNYLSLKFNELIDNGVKINSILHKFLKFKINIKFLQKRKRITINSSGKTKNFGLKWKFKLSIFEIAIIEKICGKYMNKNKFKLQIKDKKYLNNLISNFKEDEKKILPWTNQNIFLKYNINLIKKL